MFQATFSKVPAITKDSDKRLVFRENSLEKICTLLFALSLLHDFTRSKHVFCYTIQLLTCLVIEPRRLFVTMVSIKVLP